MMSVLTGGDERKKPATDKDRAELFQTMFAYTGKYRVEGDNVTVKVEASWNPAWVGTEQVRLLKLEGDRLQVFTVWPPLSQPT
jgi:hypothetical protein